MLGRCYFTSTSTFISTSHSYLYLLLSFCPNYLMRTFSFEKCLFIRHRHIFNSFSVAALLSSSFPYFVKEDSNPADIFNEIKFLCKMHSSLIYALILCLQLFPSSIFGTDESLPKCRNYQQACAFELLKFPELRKEESTTTENGDSTTAENGQQQSSTQLNDEEVQLEEGSGEAADHIHFVPISIGQSFPMYDEFVPTTPVYDYTEEPVERKEQQICNCPEEEACDFDSTERLMSFNHHIRVSFCKPVDQIFKIKCKGSRTLARVIGTLDINAESRLSTVNDTLIFCHCDSDQWSRVMVEPWINNAFAFSYKCNDR